MSDCRHKFRDSTEKKISAGAIIYSKKSILFCFKINLNFSFKIDNLTMDPDPTWAKIQDSDPNSMYYLDPQHWSLQL